MSLPRYPEYAKSQVEWAPALPAHWDVVPIRGLAKTAKGLVDGDWIETPYITDDGIRLIQTGNIGVGSYREQGFRYISPETFDLLRCTEVNTGDVLICRLADPVGRACQAPDLGVRMITSVDVCILKTNHKAQPNFLAFLLSSAGYLGHMASHCRGGTRDRVSTALSRCRELLDAPEPEVVVLRPALDRAEMLGIDVRRCPCCRRGHMAWVADLSPAATTSPARASPSVLRRAS